MKTPQTFIEPLEAAKAEGMIWNVDYKEIKDSASYNFEKARDQVMRDVYLGTGAVSEGGTDQDLYYDTPSNMHGLQSKKFMRLLGNANPSELRNAICRLVKSWKPVSDLLVELKSMIKKGRKPSTDPTKTPERTLENTGTCACCGRNVKLKDGDIVDHGFTLKWSYGERMGSCFGVGYPAVEISDRGLKAVLKAVESMKVDLEKRIDDVENNRCNLLEGDFQGAQMIMVDDARYPRYKRNELVNLRSKLHYANKDIERLTKAIAEWKPTPLPMEKEEDFQARLVGCK